MDDSLPRTGNTSSDDGGISVVPPNRQAPQTQQQDDQIAASAGMMKEVERQLIAKTESYLEEAGKVPELEPEMVDAGVHQVSGEVSIPPSVSQMGVTHSGPTASVSSHVSVKLPITDDQIMKGLHANVFDAFRWISEWCLRRLKIANFALKKVGSKATRVQTK